MRSRRAIVAVVVIGAALGTLAAAPPTPPGLARMPGELVLTKAQQTEALERMGPEAREHTSALWSDPSILPVAFASAYYRIDTDAKGKQVAVEVGGRDPDAPVNFRLPNLDTAASSGSGGRYDLYIQVSVFRQTCSGCYQWAFDNYAKWSGSNPAGMDRYNGREDAMASSWAGDLYLQADDKYGEYSTIQGIKKYLDIYRSDVTPNEGVGWSFHEWIDQSQCCTRNMVWGNATAYVRQKSWKNRTDNVVHKYFHTYGLTGGSISLTFYNAGATITPAADQWSVAAYATFSH